MSYKNPQNPGWVIANELTDAELSFLTTFAGLSYSEGDTLKIVGGVPAWVVDSSGTNKGGVVFNFYRSTGLLEEDGFKAVVPYSGTITGWSISTKDGTAQTITLNVKKAPFDDINNFTAIDGSEPIILSSAINNSDTSLSTWTTTVNAGDHIEVTVESVSGTVRGVYGIINITKTS